MATQDSKRSFTTDKQLSNLKPRPNAYEVADDGERGLRVRVYPTGRKVFRWVKPVGNGKTRAVTLGTYGDGQEQLTLAEARRKLGKLKAAHKEALRHGDPLDAPTEVKTVAQLAEVFYRDRIAPHRKRPEDVRSVIDRDITPALGKRSLEQLTTQQVGAAVTKVIDRGAAVHAGKVLALIKQMLSFGAGRGYVKYNVAAPLRAQDLGCKPYTEGKRVLSGDEIAAFYQALDRAPRVSEPVKLAYKILLLTGVRTGELLQARWEHIDLEAGTWRIPPANRKLTLRKAAKADDFLVPLSTQAVAVFEELKALAVDEEGNESPWVLASSSESGHLSDKALGLALRRLFRLEFRDEDDRMRPLLSIPSFSPHDLRRSHRTILAQLGVRPDVAERCLGHELPTVIMQTYDRYDLLEERREAEQRLGDYVDRVTGQAGDNVAELRA